MGAQPEVPSPDPTSPRSFGTGSGPGEISEPGRALAALAGRPRQLCPGAGIPRVAGLQAGPGSQLGRGGVVLPALCVFTLTPRIRTLFHFPFPLLSQLCALGTPPPRPEMAWAEAGRRRAVVMAWKSPTSRCLSLRPGGTDSPPQGHRVVVRTPTSTPPPPNRRGKHFCLMLESLFRLLVALEQGRG